MWFIVAIIGIIFLVPMFGGKESCLGGLLNIFFAGVLIVVIVGGAFALNPILGLIAIWIVVSYFKANQNN